MPAAPDQLALLSQTIYWWLMIPVLIRRPQPQELDSVRALVQTVVDETYGGLWVPSPLPIDEENWHLSWIAELDTKIIGVVLTGREWLDDLWVLRGSRGCGVGHRLLAQGEAEIVARGHRTLRLRVVQSNAAAIRFYQQHGWRIAREFPHEKFPVITVEMFKSFRPDAI
jgi:GNAT superfamily N-acetyltransferase